MPRVLITAEVNDLGAWEGGFRSHGDLFKQMGVVRMEYATVTGNRVAVCGETADLDAYMKVFNSRCAGYRPGLRMRAGRASVVGDDERGARRDVVRCRPNTY